MFHENIADITKIIFLDIDGVLCTTRAYNALPHHPTRQYGFDVCDPVGISILNGLYNVDPDHTAFVMSSSWRQSKTQDYCFAVLKEDGFEGKFHPDWGTPELGEYYAVEIKAWLDAHPPVPRYVVIHDGVETEECWRQWKKSLGENAPVVLTSTHDGILLKNMIDAHDILHGISLSQARNILRTRARPS